MSEKEKKDPFDYFLVTKQENEWRMNKILGIISVIAIGILLFCYILTKIGIFTLSAVAVGFLAVVICPLSLFIFLIGTVFNVKKSWVKYCIITVFWVDMIILFGRLSMHTVPVLPIPVLLSLLYSDKRFSSVTMLMGVVALFLAHLAAVKYSVVHDPLINTYYRALVFGYIPRLFQYILFCIAASFINRNSIHMVERGYFYANRTEELLREQKRSHYETVKNLASITENKSEETGEHISRVFEYMMVFTRHAGLSENEAYDVSLAAMLHDVGKLRVPDAILNKPGRLTPEEFEVVKLHTTDGKALLENTGNEVLDLGAVIAVQHHERWDGLGYHGLKGDEIDKYSQMMSVIDVFDALTSGRCYKPAWPVEEAYKEIVKNKGTQFSPYAVGLFVKCFSEIEVIYRKSNPAALPENRAGQP